MQLLPVPCAKCSGQRWPVQALPPPDATWAHRARNACTRVLLCATSRRLQPGTPPLSLRTRRAAAWVIPSAAYAWEERPALGRVACRSCLQAADRRRPYRVRRPADWRGGEVPTALLGEGSNACAAYRRGPRSITVRRGPRSRPASAVEKKGLGGAGAAERSDGKPLSTMCNLRVP
jgi:hypothetical protein